MDECKCKNWKKNLPIINSALILYNGHGLGQIKRCFTYCPYCGLKLKEGAKD